MDKKCDHLHISDGKALVCGLCKRRAELLAQIAGSVAGGIAAGSIVAGRFEGSVAKSAVEIAEQILGEAGL